MAERIATGEVLIEVNDAAALAAMERIERKFDRSMQKIDHEEAVAKIDADIAPLDDKIKNAQRRLKKWEGEKARKRIDADTKAIDTQIKKVKREIKRLEADRAVVEIDVKGDREAINAIERVRRAEEERAKAAETRQRELDRVERDAEKRRMSAVLAESRSRAALNKQREREESTLRTAEFAAYRESEKRSIAQRKAQQVLATGIDREAQKIGNLQKQYARLTDRLETITKKRPIGKEARAKVTLDAADVILQMERIKAELNFMGSHPPVDIKADVDRKGLRKVVGFFSDVLTSIGNKAAGLGDLTLRLGPFTSSIRQAAVALSFLGPTITDIVGAASALIGVLGAGISGAAIVGTGAVTGLGLSFLGLKFATRNTAQEITNARTAINAYASAEEKYGKSDPKTIKKLHELNHVMASISPLARETAKGVEHFYGVWDAHTATTRRNLGIIAREGFKALNEFTPTWAHRTNEMSTIMRTNLDKAFGWLRSKEGVGTLDTILRNFNKGLPAAFHGLGAAGHAFLNFAKEGSGYLPQLFAGFDRWMGKLLDFTQRDDFGSTVKRWVQDAKDVVRFFGSAAKVLVHFFGDGSKAGDRFINTMSDAFDRWDKFITSTQGKKSLGDYFQNSVQGVEALYAAFKPLIELFTLWSIGLEPAVQVISEMFAWLTRAAETVGKLVGLSNPLKTLGATLGAMWAIGKVGAFVSMLARVVALLKEAAVAGGIFGKGGVFSTVFSGGLLKGARGGSGILEAGTAAANEMRVAVAEGGTAAAAEIRAAMAAGGGIAGAEGALGAGGANAIRRGEQTASGLIIPSGTAGAAEKAGASAEKAAGRFALLGTAASATTGFLGTFAEMALGPVGLGLGAATYAAYKLYSAHQKLSKSTQTLINNDTALNTGIALQAASTHDLGGAAIQLAQAHLTEKQAQRDVNALRRAGKTNTDQYKQALINLAAAQQQTTDAQKQWTDSAQTQLKAATDQQNAAKGNIAQRQKELDQRKEELKELQQLGIGEEGLKKKRNEVARATAALRGEQEILRQAQDRATLATLNQKRALALLPPLAATAARTVASLTRSLGTSKVAQIAIKFPDPRKAQQVMAQLDKTIASGTPKNRAFNVVANSKDAEQALRRLNAIKVTPKRLEIIEHGGRQAVDMVERITGKKIPKKLVPIVEEGGPKALAVLRDIFGFRLPKKTQPITQQGAQGVLGVLAAIVGKRLPNKTFATILHDLASGGLNAILARLNSLHDKTITVTTRSGGSFHVVGGARAAGGPVDAATKRDNTIPSSMSSRTTGGKYQRPTFLVGEERKPEFVIATNPAYRDKNIAYWMQAAQALGIPGFASGGVFSGSGYFASTTVGGPPKNTTHPLSDKNFSAAIKARRKIKKPLGGRGRNKLHKSLQNDDLSSVAYVGKLTSQADDLDREFSIRSSEQPPEPETFITQVGTDPVTGDPLYDIDQAAINAYADTFNPLLEVKNALVQVYQNLVTAIPNALQQLVARKQHAQENAASIKRDIQIAEARVAAEQKKKHPNQDRIKALRASIAADKKELSFSTGLADSAQNDFNSLSDSRKEAGFNYREEVIDRNGILADQAALTGRATKERDQANPQAPTGTSDTGGGAGGGAGGTGGDGITADQQAQLDQVTTLQGIVTRGNFLNNAAVSAFGSSGDIGTGNFANAFAGAFNESATGSAAATRLAGAVAGTAAASSIAGGSSAVDSATGLPTSGGGSSVTLIQNVNTLHPADPATLDAIGQAATAGISFQGSTATPRTVTGL